MKKLGAGDAAVAQTAVESLTGVEPKSSIDGTAPDRAPAMLQYHASVRPGREIMEDWERGAHHLPSGCLLALPRGRRA
jgi:hypothetical protein